MSFSEDSNKYYRALERIEAHRRTLLRRSEDPAWKVVPHWRGTILPIIIKDPLLWLNLGFYILLRAMSTESNRFAGFLKGFLMGDKELLKTIGDFLSFFLVFFVVQNNTRFCEMHDYTMAAKADILKCASIAQATLPESDALKIVRYLNAAFAAGFVGLSDAYTFEGYFKEINKSFLLLQTHEMERVEICRMDTGGSCYREIIQWIQKEINQLTDSHILDHATSKVMKSILLDLQSNISQLYNYKDQPVIFFYVHLVAFVSVLYLPLFTIHAASKLKGKLHIVSEIVISAMIILLSVIVVGLRELGKKLSDPFGSDYEDLSVMHYVTYTWRESARIMAAKLPFELNDNTELIETERNITFLRAPIGEAWEFDLSVSTQTNSENDEPIFHDSQIS